MAITVLNTNSEEFGSHYTENHASRTKLTLIVILFAVTLASFVSQTEFTSQAYLLGYSEPFFLLLITHGSWLFFWPSQVLVISLWRTIQKYNKPLNHSVHEDRLELLEERDTIVRRSDNVGLLKYFKVSIIRQIHNVHHTGILIYEANVNGNMSTNCNKTIKDGYTLPKSSSLLACISSFIDSPSFKYLFKRCFYIAVVLNVAGATWYAAMSLTYASNVTAIYNCSAFAAYAFAIPMLKEKFSWLKASSVLIALSGVFIVTYSGQSSTDSQTYPYKFWGNFIILIGAILYGYYEVLYKKYLCVPHELAYLLTPRRQLTFSNFMMAFMGIFSSLILGSGIFLVEILGIHHFRLFDFGNKTSTIWLYNCGSIVSNMLFSASFLCLMALTSPVLSSVSSLVTIFLIGIVEWSFFGNILSLQQLLGDFFVIFGFVLLAIASWNEISNGSDHDEVEEASMYSYGVASVDQDAGVMT